MEINVKRGYKTEHFTNFNKVQMSIVPRSGGAVTLKTGRQEVTGSNPGHACRPSRSEFSVIFSETRIDTGQDLLERPTRRATPIGPGPTSGQLVLNIQLNPTEMTIVRIPVRIMGRDINLFISLMLIAVFSALLQPSFDFASIIKYRINEWWNKQFFRVKIYKLILGKTERCKHEFHTK